MKLYRRVLFLMPALAFSACQGSTEQGNGGMAGGAGAGGAAGTSAVGSSGAAGTEEAGTSGATGTEEAGSSGALTGEAGTNGEGGSGVDTNGAAGTNGAGQSGIDASAGDAGNAGEAGAGGGAGAGGSAGSDGGGNPPVTPGSRQWTGNFDNFNTPAWGRAWGVSVPGDSHSFGQNDPGMAAFADPTSPDGHQVLKVSYAAMSSARSCTKCPLPDGGQFYQDLTAIGRSDLANAQVLHMRYYVKFGDSTSAFDFGKAGKMPGLWGGIAGQESGCVGTGGTSWSTRFMWRGGKAEVYLYDPTHSAGGCGADIFWTSGTWQGDAKWHYVEQAVNRMTGTVDVWYDGNMALQNHSIGSGYGTIPFRGIFFSTFMVGTHQPGVRRSLRNPTLQNTRSIPSTSGLEDER